MYHNTRGVRTPGTDNFFVKNVKFYNFNENMSAFSSCSGGRVLGGVTTKFEGLEFVNVVNRVFWG
jgi:hypothetical protein